MKTIYKIFHPKWTNVYIFYSFHEAIHKLNELTNDTSLAFNIETLKVKED